MFHTLHLVETRICILFVARIRVFHSLILMQELALQIVQLVFAKLQLSSQVLVLLVDALVFYFEEGNLILLF